VEATETEVSFLTTLLGSARIFFAPNTFGEYWPDYGYSWTEARSRAGCDALNQDQNQSEIGRISLVTPRAGTDTGYIGLDLTSRISSDTNANIDQKRQETVTLRQLCEWFADENATQIERYVGELSNLWSMEGTWTRSVIDSDRRYRLVGMGQVVTPDEEESGSIEWNVPNGNLLEWYAPALEAVGSEPVWRYNTGMPNGPIYYLRPTSGERVLETIQEFQVTVDDEGRINAEDLPRLSAGTSFELWTEAESTTPSVSINPWLTAGTWTRAGIDSDRRYRLVGMGQVIEPDEREPGSIEWNVPGGNFVEWYAPSFDPVGSETVWRYNSEVPGGPVYYLRPIAGNSALENIQQFRTVIDEEGRISAETLPSIPSGSSFSLWAEIETSEHYTSSEWWLMTDHTVPNPEWTVGNRFLGSR
jgi:hypothetical protein